MITVYKIINVINDKIYFGITKTSLNLRWNSHCFTSKNKNTPLYAAMRKYGQDKFSIVPIVYCDTWDYACKLEIGLISSYNNLYNLASGGQGGYVIPPEKKEQWRDKLIKARQGRTPSLGMKHSEENKRFFSECSKRRKPLYPTLDVNKIGFIEANKLFGISKTHYYRLLKRTKNNDLS